MSMATVVICIFILALPCLSANFVTLDCPKEAVGQFWTKLVLECVVKPKQDNARLDLHSVFWRKNDSSILSYEKNNTTKEPGYSFAEQPWNNTNVRVSLLINNVTMKHEGKYTCQVSAMSGWDIKDIKLKVTAKYNKPIIKRLENNILECSSSGGYPVGELRWFDEDKKTNIPGDTMKVDREEGLFQLSRNLTLDPGSNSSRYTCRLFNASGDNEFNATFNMPSDPDGTDKIQGDKPLDEAKKIVPPVVVVGSIIIGLLLVLVLRRYKRSQMDRRLSAAPLMGLSDVRCEHNSPEEDEKLNPV